MATFGITKKAIHKPSVKGRKVKLCTVTGDTDIGAADTGYIVTADSLGFNYIEGCISGVTQDGVYFVTGTPVVGTTPTIPGTSLRIQYYNADDAVEAAAGEDGVDGTIVDLLVIGY